MNNIFKTYRDSYEIQSRINNPKIIVGKRSYYAGYYHGKHFEDCVLYLDSSDKNKDVDKLIIGKYCSIASGATFMMSGNQGHRHDWIATYPLDIIEDHKDSSKKVPAAFLKKGDTVIGNDVWIGFEALIMPGVSIADGARGSSGALAHYEPVNDVINLSRDRRLDKQESWGYNENREQYIKTKKDFREAEHILQLTVYLVRKILRPN